MKKMYLLISIIITQCICAQNILGIDVSHHQGVINWTQVYNSGKVFAYVKATEGKTYTDPNFYTNMNNGENAGVVMGAYHFARPDNNTATEDANNFINVAGSYIGNGFLPPVLDIEDTPSNVLSIMFTPSQLTSWVQSWINTVVTQTGVTPIIYTNTTYADYLNSSLNTYGLWIAKPNSSATSPPGDIGNWNTWMFKQYSWVGSVSGISGNVDLNVFNGNTTAFNNLIGSNSSQPTNDESNNAINLQSNTSCNYTSGSVQGATSDSSWSIASCDNYSNPIPNDVFYKFTAVSNSHTIFINPSSGLDPVLSLYTGSNTNNLNEIFCADIGGGNNGNETINATGLTIGQTYWIRVYDYGAPPYAAPQKSNNNSVKIKIGKNNLN